MEGGQADRFIEYVRGGADRNYDGVELNCEGWWGDHLGRLRVVVLFREIERQKFQSGK